MDYEKYYIRKGYAEYVIHFGNNNGLTKNVIQNMFSRFGKNISVDLRGRTYGLCFVTYKNLEDVKQCIDGFQNHKTIKILPHKHKCNTDVTKTKGGKGNRKAIDNQGSLSDSMPMSCCKQDKFEDQSTKSLNETKKIFNNTQIPSLMSIKSFTDIDTTRTPCTKVLPAEEVIVANIHPCLSIHYILHLFEKYNPIAISQMMTTPIIGLSYCHVYYQTRREANASVKEFDTCQLFGKCLIVLTYHQLVHKALQL